VFLSSAVTDLLPLAQIYWKVRKIAPSNGKKKKKSLLSLVQRNAEQIAIAGIYSNKREKVKKIILMRLGLEPRRIAPPGNWC